MQFIVLTGQFFNTWAVMFDLYREGQLPESQWKVVTTDLKAILNTPGGLALWSDILVHNYDSGFVDFVNDVLSAGEGSYDIRTGGVAQEG